MVKLGDVFWGLVHSFIILFIHIVVSINLYFVLTIFRVDWVQLSGGECKESVVNRHSSARLTLCKPVYLLPVPVATFALPL